MKTEQLDYTRADELAREIISITQKYLISHTKDEIKNLIWDAYLFAREAHGLQTRKSGDPYINHPLEATKILTTLKPDITSILACILHDVIEDTDKTEDDIREKFGDDVAKICQ